MYTLCRKFEFASHGKCINMKKQVGVTGIATITHHITTQGTLRKRQVSIIATKHPEDKKVKQMPLSSPAG